MRRKRGGGEIRWRKRERERQRENTQPPSKGDEMQKRRDEETRTLTLIACKCACSSSGSCCSATRHPISHMALLLDKKKTKPSINTNCGCTVLGFNSLADEKEREVSFALSLFFCLVSFPCDVHLD